MRTCLLLAVLAIISPAHSASGVDAFSDAISPTRFTIRASDGSRLTLKGRALMGVYDLEGDGGRGHDSGTDTATIGTRSPTFGLRAADLATRVDTPGGLAFRLELDFLGRGARAARAAWLQKGHGSWRWEVGLNRPIAAADDQSTRDSLSERIYWGAQEMHGALALDLEAWDVPLRLAASVAVMRPIGSRAVNDAAQRQGTIVVLSHVAAESFSGNRPVYGLLLGGGPPQIEVTLFGFLGTFSEDRGEAELAARIPGYRTLGDAKDDRFWWAGGRAMSKINMFRLGVEGIVSREGRLQRTVGQGQMAWHLPWAPIQTSAYYGIYHLENGARFRSAAPAHALTWNWRELTLAATAQLSADLVRLHFHYTRLTESRGTGPDFPNNETTFELELRF